MKTLTYILLILSPVLFWVLWFVPTGGGENCFFLLAFLTVQGLSVISALASAYFALKFKRDVILWLILILDLSPIIWIYFIFPFTYRSTL